MSPFSFNSLYIKILNVYLLESHELIFSAQTYVDI